jgi:hypothetical protein
LGHSAATRRTSPNVEGSSFGCGDWTASEGLDLAREQDVAARQHALRRVRIGMYQLDWDVVIDPLCAMHCGGCRSGDGPLPVGPQPGRGNTLLQRRLCLFGQVDVRQNGSVLRP